MSGLAVEAIVFDFDGVLVESVDVKTRAFAELYRSHGEAVMEQVVAYHLAHGGVSRFEKFRHFHNAFLGLPLSPEEESRLGDEFSRLVEDTVVASPWVAGAKEFLDANWQRLPLYVASGTPEEELRRIVARRGMERYFRGVFGAPAKKGEILRRIAAERGCRPERLLMVGDAMTDYDGAIAATTAFLGRVPAGIGNPFPPGVTVMPDLTGLAGLLWG